MARFVTGRDVRGPAERFRRVDNRRWLRPEGSSASAGGDRATGNWVIVPAMVWFPWLGRRVIAVIAAGVLLVLAAVGYLVLNALNRGLEVEIQAYEKWVNGFAAGLGDRPAVVILEPDALAGLSSCSGNAQRQARLQMLSYAVKSLQSKRDQVYLDAGHSNWVPAGQMAARLRAADVAQAYGFALNVSNYDTTDRRIGYAAELDRDLGRAK